MKILLKFLAIALFLTPAHMVIAQDDETTTILLTATISEDSSEPPACTVDAPVTVDLGELTPAGSSGSLSDIASMNLVIDYTCEPGATFYAGLEESTDSACDGVPFCEGVLYGSTSTSTSTLLITGSTASPALQGGDDSIELFRTITGLDNAEAGEYSGSVQLVISYQ